MVGKAALTTLVHMGACEKTLFRSADPRGATGGSGRDPADTPADTDQFVGLLTEELRTNLQAVLGFTQLMQRDHTEPLPERQRERVRRVLDAGERLLRVLDDAGALWRIQSNQIPMAVRSVEVNRIFQRVRAELEAIAVSRKLELVIDGSALTVPEVAADARGLTEILLKLTANAIAYSKPHGRVTLRVAPVAFARLRISVIDTGIGIPLEEQQKLFRPFPRVARPSRCSEGAGLGLATCQRLAALMNGTVGCHSIPDRGSEFWIELPAYQG